MEVVEEEAKEVAHPLQEEEDEEEEGHRLLQEIENVQEDHGPQEDVDKTNKLTGNPTKAQREIGKLLIYRSLRELPPYHGEDSLSLLTID